MTPIWPRGTGSLLVLTGEQALPVYSWTPMYVCGCLTELGGGLCFRGLSGDPYVSGI